MKFLETFVQSGNSGSQIFRENTTGKEEENTKNFVKSPEIRRQSYQNLTEKVKNFVNLAFWRNFCLFSKNATLVTLFSEKRSESDHS